MSETTHLALPYLAAAQAQKHVTHNEALGRLDVVVQLGVLDAAMSAPPATPEDGDRYIVAAGASDAWEGHDGEVAAFVDGVWTFAVPGSGWVAFDAASESMLVHADGSWVAIGSFLGAVARFGVNTAADDTNRLAVRSEAALFKAIEDADGGSGDVRIVLSKEVEADTASLIFQDGFSGRAEIGLAGDDDLVFKVSDDGTEWIEAIRIDSASGVPAVLYDNGASGLAATSLHGAIDELAQNSTTPASTSAAGIVELATDAETRAGTDTSRAVTPAGLRSAAREKLTASRNYYVRTDGSNSNDGLSNTSGGAFLTIQKAIDTAAALDLSIYSVTINVAAGTYTGAVALKSFIGSGTITIIGDTTTPSNVVIDVTGSCFTADNVVGIYVIRGVKMQATVSCVVATGASNVLLYEVEFGAAGGYHAQSQRGSLIYLLAGYTISGGAYAHYGAENGGLIIDSNKTITMSGTFSFSIFAYAARAAIIQASGITWSGTYTVTATRYSAALNAIIDTAGGGGSYFPGNLAGATSTGGQYA